jgi:glycosyltransferase involved in cell wall biosynthesis
MTDLHRSGTRPKVHVIYEYGNDYRPYSSSFLRLIRPLTHPSVQAHLDTTFSLDYNNELVDVVIIDRLWRFDVSLPLVQELVNKIRRKGTHIIYSLDDNYFDLASYEQSQPLSEILSVVSFLLRQADAVLVTTPALRQRLLKYNPNIHILPNQLDERLLVPRYPSEKNLKLDQKHIVIGYMGTFTHDDDFMMVVPVIKSIQLRYPGRVEFQIVGVVSQEQTRKIVQELPVRFVFPRPEEHEYPLFMLWLTGYIRWDIAISPLVSSAFNDCKSDIKFLDYSSIGAAGVFSSSPAYSSTVIHRQNGWLVENTPGAWEEALANLIQDEPLRLTIAQNASRYLYSQRTLAQHATDWVKTIYDLFDVKVGEPRMADVKG